MDIGCSLKKTMCVFQGTLLGGKSPLVLLFHFLDSSEKAKYFGFYWWFALLSVYSLSFFFWSL
jgi:hypothetical protein